MTAGSVTVKEVNDYESLGCVTLIREVRFLREV